MKLRIFTTALLAALVLAVAGLAGPVHAQSNSGSDDLDSEAEFQELCARGGGRFHRRADTGAITCWYDDGTVIYCDKGAKNCGTIHPSKYEESSTATNSQGPSQASSGYGSSPGSSPSPKPGTSPAPSNAPSRPRR